LLDLARRELSHDLVGLPTLRDEVERRRDRFGYTLLGSPFGPGVIERDSVTIAGAAALARNTLSAAAQRKDSSSSTTP
jgi:hypothetical protein